jgi:DNA modification methylase
LENTLIAKKNSKRNKLEDQDRKFHEWYRFVLSYPPHLVDAYINRFGLDKNSVLFDPFCGTGTTLVESKLKNITSIGAEASPFAHFVSSVKVDWDIGCDKYLESAKKIKSKVLDKLEKQNIIEGFPTKIDNVTVDLKNVSPQKQKWLIKNSISPLPLHKALTLLEEIKNYKTESFYNHLLLAFVNAAVNDFSNLRFGPEVGVGRIKEDTPVIQPWFNEVEKQIEDLISLEGNNNTKCNVFHFDTRNEMHQISDNSIDAIITSPPYPNEKDYSRTTRLESVLLDFITNRKELQAFKKALIRSNSRGIYVKDEDEKWIEDFESVQKIAEQIEERRKELNKNSGFEKLYSKVTKHYFGGMYRHLLSIKTKMKSGSKLAYVVGDQASYLRIMIRTGEILAEIAEDIGYKVNDIELFRTRFATATEEDLREEVLILEKE